jgi:ADP-ribosyl-[dinitrogen reductase] hydrolase
MLLELAVGDAYGAGFEYANEMVKQYNDLTRYVKHPRHKEMLPGYYTDDTQMSVAIAELIVSGDEWTPLNIASRFVECFKRDPRTGYAGRFYQFLIETKDGQHFLDRIIPESDKSGAAMRAMPIGIYPDIDEVIDKVSIQAKVTHDTPDGVSAAIASALMTHYFVYDKGTKEDVGKWIETVIPNTKQWSEPYKGKVKAKGWMSVQAAITAVHRNSRLSELLQDCISFTGDVDTVATIALAGACLSREYNQDLPQHLIDTLENGKYGRDYLQKLDKQLLLKIQK